MGEAIGNIPCPTCRQKGRDRTGNHLMIFPDGGGYCQRCQLAFSADKVVQWSAEIGHPLPEGVKLKEPTAGGSITFENPEPTVAQDTGKVYPPDVPTTTTKPHQWHRGIGPDAWAAWGFSWSCDFSGEPRLTVIELHPIKGEKVYYRVRDVENKLFNCTAPKNVKLKLIGMDKFPPGSSKRLVITEAPEDAVACWVALQRWNVAVVSLPNGTGSVMSVKDNLDYVNSFEEVILAFDGDEAGEKAVVKVVEMLPQVKVVVFPDGVDANDYFMCPELDKSQLPKMIFNADRYKPPFLQESDEDLILEAITPVTVNQGYPWENLNKITYGLFDHTIISIGAAPGVGKSVFVQQIVLHQMQSGCKVALFDLENSQAATLRRLTGFVMGLPLHLPGTEYNAAEALGVSQTLLETCMIYNSSHFNGKWERIMQGVRWFYQEGARVFVIDPVSSLVAHVDASEGNKILGQVMMDLQEFAKVYPVKILMVNHLNSPKTGKAHEDGAMPKPSQFTGSKAQWRYSNVMLGLARNMNAEDLTERNLLKVGVLKHREAGHLVGDSCYLSYDKDSGRLAEAEKPLNEIFEPMMSGPVTEISGGELML